MMFKYHVSLQYRCTLCPHAEMHTEIVESLYALLTEDVQDYVSTPRDERICPKCFGLMYVYPHFIEVDEYQVPIKEVIE